MTKEEIFNYFFTNSANLGFKAIGITMLAGFAIGLLVCLTYYWTYRGVAYNVKFNISLMLLLLISDVIMLMISSNIIISLGMVGALSIVRFRTAIKDSRDTVFIFWAIAEGLCVGSNNFKLALTTTLFIAFVIVLSGMLFAVRNKYILIIRNGNELIDVDALIQNIKPYVKDYKLRTANRSDNSQEFVFEVRTRGEISPSFIDSLKMIKGVSAVNWVSESGDTIG